MKWVGLMNNISNIADEIVIKNMYMKSNNE